MKVVAAIHDLMFSSKVRAAAGPAVEFVPRGAEVAAHVAQAGAEVLLLDLGARTFDALAALRAVKGAGRPVHVIAYVDHVEEHLIDEARAAGADAVLSKGEFARKLPALLQGLGVG